MDASTEELPLTAGLAHRPATSVPVRPASQHQNQHQHHSHHSHGHLSYHSALTSAAASSRMQYRSRPVSVAVDPVSLVISECINITSAIQKYARSQHLSVSAILGGGAPNVAMQQSFRLGAGSSEGGAGRRAGSRRGGGGASRGGNRPGSAGGAGGADNDFSSANRWGLRGKKGKSMADNPLISGFGRLRQELAGVEGSWNDETTERKRNF